MSYYDDSSLFVAPNGYKTSVLFAQKPMDANGQLAFTRSNDTATRVAENSLIEKVRTNLLLQSNSFDTTWTNTNTTETSGQAGYDGTNNAWLLNATSAGGSIVQSFSVAGIQTFSVYAKAGTYGFIRVQINGTGFDKRIDVNLANGTIGTAGSGNLRASTTSIGSGWWRIQLAADTTSTALRFYPIVADNDLSGTSGNILIQDAQLETGDIATDYIPTTTTAVSVGPVANLPRLNYPINSDGSVGCPSLLLEPQRTNLALCSEQFDNAGWTKVNVTISANATTSPDGYASADKIVGSAGVGGEKNTFQLISITIGQAFTISAFFKKSEYKLVFVRAGGQGGSPYVIYNLDTQAVVSTSGASSTKIEDYGNGWYRVSFTLNSATGTTCAPNLVFLPDSGYTLSAINVPQYTGDGTSGGFIWGCQLEANGAAYGTSYIGPTLGAAVTRVADACSKTGISSLIGQTEGTIYLEFENNALTAYPNEYIFTIRNTAGSSQLFIRKEVSSNIFTVRLIVGGVNIFTNTSSDPIDGINKIAVSYKTGDSSVFLNGTQRGTTSTSAFSGSSFDDLYFNSAGSLNPELLLKQLLVFPTRLSNAQLAELTTL